MYTFANNMKTVFLLGALMGLFVLVGYLLGGVQGMVFGFIFGGIGNLIAFFFSDKIAIRAMQGREVMADGSGPVVPGAMAPADLHRMVDELRQRAGLPMPRVYICPHDAPNAFATGRSPSKAAVAFTQGLLRSMSYDEIAGVAAHELAHIKHRDTLTSAIAATIAGVLAVLAQSMLFFGLGRGRDSNPLALLVIPLAAFGAVLIKAAISRTREFAADAEGAHIAGSAGGLASALAKLDALSRRIPLVQPNPAQNNMFIVEPLAGGARTLTSLFATHPPTAARIEALRRLRLE